jgi:glycosyltransferase involved in cell wall biosynthesis
MDVDVLGWSRRRTAGKRASVYDERAGAMRIALIGTRGVPATYGGFETAVEEVGSRLVEYGHEVVVYCRNRGQRLTHYKGMSLVNLPALRRRSLETLSHTAVSVAHVVAWRADCAIVFNSANAPFLPLLQLARIPTAVHVDGLEHRRGKWSGFGRRYYLFAERFAALHADHLIADAEAIGDYLVATYGRKSRFIPYGAPIVQAEPHVLTKLGLTARAYHLVVARFEPENHVDLIVRGFRESSARNPLVVVGGTPYPSGYAAEVQQIAASDTRIECLGPVWDQDILDQLYANSLTYLHGHSVGGTNPSLLRAMGAGAAVIAYDVNFNREVAGSHARFFRDLADVARETEAAERDPAEAARRGLKLQCRAAKNYRWDDVARAYEELAVDLAVRR